MSMKTETNANAMLLESQGKKNVAKKEILMKEKNIDDG